MLTFTHSAVLTTLDGADVFVCLHLLVAGIHMSGHPIPPWHAHFQNVANMLLCLNFKVKPMLHLLCWRIYH